MRLWSESDDKRLAPQSPPAIAEADLTSLLGAWGIAGVPADLDGSGLVDGGDLTILLGAWGECF